MTAEGNVLLIASFKSFSKVASIVVVLIGGLALIGWAFNIGILKSVLPGRVSMNPTTAVTFILAGISLWLLLKEKTGQRLHRIGQALAFLVALIGFLKLGGYFLGWDFHMDHVLFRGKLEDGSYGLTRIAPNTALNFLLLGLALLFLDAETRRGRRPAEALTFIAAFVSFLALLGYLYGIKSFYGLTSYIPMAFNTALAFTLLCAGILLARPDHGLAATLASDSPGGIMARRLLPAAIAVPAVLGWLRLQGQRAGLYDTEFGISLVAVLTVVGLAILIVWNARSLDRAGAERRRAEEERDRFFILSLDMLCIAGFDGYFKHLNPAWENTLGWTKEELLAKPYLEFVHSDDRESTITEAKKLSTGGVTISFENRYLSKDGSYKWLLWNATPFAGQQLIYATARDITERKQAEEMLKSYAARLEAANKELEAFSYSVSHDLRAPLRGIDGFSKVLLEDYKNRLDAPGQDYLKRVRAAAQRMAQLIEDMLNLARVARSEMHWAKVDLSAMAQAIAAELKQSQPERKVEFVITPGLTVEGDSQLLRVALQNLLDNAYKFTGKKPRAQIEFGVMEQDGKPAYFVRDDGDGFDMTYAHKLFGVFQRLHSMTEFPGTGVGLATVQRIIQRHGGRVWAEGAVEKGATFYFTL